MNPYKFEQLVGQLLEAMGYEQVEVTKASGDKGVDVIGQVQVGITTITEVVQVKECRTPSLDRISTSCAGVALPQGHSRYAHHHREICSEMCRSGALSGAAPITLIDGDRLLELLIENNVGIRRSNAVELLDVDLQLFDELEMD